jgi:hypothetical protein
MKIGVTLKSSEALDIYQAATGKRPPETPAGCNTCTTEFVTADGLPAVIVRQSGFKRVETDPLEEVNGLMAIVALDAPDHATGWASIRQFLEGLK